MLAIIYGETNLKGEIGGKIFEPSGNPYFVSEDIIISSNTTTVLKPGCVFLFNSFCGIHVHGTIIVEGAPKQSVVFTSIHDSSYNKKSTQLPNSFDWNGIYISEEANDAKFRNFKLMYSVYGIKSLKEDITIQKGYFLQNGQFHFTVNDNIQYVQDNLSYSFNTKPKNTTSDTSSIQDTTQKVVRVDSTKSNVLILDKTSKDTILNITKTEDRTTTKDQKINTPKKEKKTITGVKKTAFICLGTGGASLISGLVSSVVTLSNFKKTEDPKNDYNKYYTKVRTGRAVYISSFCIGGTLTAISLFLLGKKEKTKVKKKVSFNYSIGKRNNNFSITTQF